VSWLYLDTVGLIALWSANDQWHLAAESALVGVRQRKLILITTTYVLLECGNAAARRPYRKSVDLLRQDLESRDRLVIPSDEDWASAWSAYRRGEADQAGIVDHTSFAVMRRLGIREAFTNDRHFKAAGFQVLF
jgi:predicted nucleic acid-binding protein